MESAYFGMSAAAGRSAWSRRTNDRAAAVVVDALLRAGDVLLDIGAHDASGVLAAAARVGPLGHVHAFEAAPEVAQDAADEIARLGLAQVTLHELALSQANGQSHRFIAPLVGERPFGVRIGPGHAGAGMLALLALFERLRFVVVEGGGEAPAQLGPLAGAGLALFSVRRSALRCRLERLDDAALSALRRDVVAVRRPHTPLPASLHPKSLAALLAD